MSENIQAPKKRTYTRKPKVVIQVDEIPTSEPPVVSDSETSTTSTDSFVPPEQVPQKPKRTYKKKVVEPVVAVVDEPAATVVTAGAIETLGREAVVTGTSTKICKLKFVCALPTPWLAAKVQSGSAVACVP